MAVPLLCRYSLKTGWGQRIMCPNNNIGISGSFTAMNYLILYGNKAASHQEEWVVGGHNYF